MNIPPGRAFDLLQRRVAFGVELLDPISAAIVSRDVQVTLENDVTQPLLSASGRFAWLAGTRVASAVMVTSADSRYASRRYPLDFQQPQLSSVPLFRLSLRTSAAYPYARDITLVRGRLLETRPSGTAAPRPVAAADFRLRWRDVAAGDRDGPMCTPSMGYFAVALPLAAGARPRVQNDQSLLLALVIERPDLPGLPVRVLPLNGVRELTQQVLSEPIIWDELS